MKKIAIILFAMATISSCNVAKQVSDYAKKHCKQESVFDYKTGKVEVTYQCDSLFKAPFVSDKCKTVNVCIDVATGSVWGVASCDSVYNLNQIVASLKKK